MSIWTLGVCAGESPVTMHASQATATLDPWSALERRAGEVAAERYGASPAQVITHVQMGITRHCGRSAGNLLMGMECGVWLGWFWTSASESLELGIPAFKGAYGNRLAVGSGSPAGEKVVKHAWWDSCCLKVRQLPASLPSQCRCGIRFGSTSAGILHAWLLTLPLSTVQDGCSGLVAHRISVFHASIVCIRPRNMVSTHGSDRLNISWCTDLLVRFDPVPMLQFTL